MDGADAVCHVLPPIGAMAFPTLAIAARDCKY
jgi:hypothetical protein